MEDLSSGLGDRCRYPTRRAAKLALLKFQHFSNLPAPRLQVNRDPSSYNHAYAIHFWWLRSFAGSRRG